jgi:hypothetical protein
MKQLVINDREREILLKLNEHFKLNLATEDLENRPGIQKVLDLAWRENTEKLHDLGIPQFKIAQMYSGMLGFNGFVRDFIHWQKVEPFCWVEYA